MKKLIISAFGVLLALPVLGSPLTPGEAIARMGANTAKVKGISKGITAEPVYTQKTLSGEAAAYVFNNANGNGYVILSADDVAYPMLGYSESGSFDKNNMPDGMKFWLEMLSEQINYASEQNARKAMSPAYSSEKSAITPLLSTKWDQGAPFNDQCPTPNNSTQKCYTGCVATSMAQVMNYHKYPEIGKGTISYSCSNINRYLTLNLSKREFDWANMLDIYADGNYNAAQVDAVAYLMKACGYSVQMAYGTDASGAASSYIPLALRDNFSYDENLHLEQRIFYSESGWEQIIYNDLKHVGPVIMNGQSPSDGGHSFVCDGYDGKGYYHFNWGWGGMSDGYYLLGALNPEAQGIGGYAGGFNFYLNAILGVQPPTGTPYSDADAAFVQYGNLRGTVNGSKLYFSVSDYSRLGWGNAADRTLTGSFGARFVNVATGQIVTTTTCSLNSKTSVTMGANTLYNASNSILYTDIPTLADGKYKVEIVCKMTTGDWHPVIPVWGYNNFTYLEKSGSEYTVENTSPNKLKIDKVELSSELYFNKNSKFTVTLTNNTDIELTQGLCPRLYQGGFLRQVGGSILATVGPKETATVEFVSKFEKASNASNVTSPTTFTLELYDPQTEKSLGTFGEVTMNPAPSQTSLSLSLLDVDGAKKIEYSYGGKNYKPYVVEDKNDFTIDFNYLVRYGYFDGSVKLTLYEVDEATNVQKPINDELYSNMPFIAGGQSREIKVKVSEPELKSDVLYIVEASYAMGGSRTKMGNMTFVIGSTGIDSVSEELDLLPVRYYNLQGVEVAEPQSGQILIRKVGSKVEKVVIK